MDKVKTELLEFNVNWNSIKRACLRTIGLEAGDKEPPKAWKRKLLICRHSPIRKGSITWKWPEIPFFAMGHFVRHNVGCTPFVQTSRSDRTNTPREERSQMAPVSMEMDANLQSLLNISERRLCLCADSITRSYWEDLIQVIEKYDDDIAWACVPQCVRAGSCVEPFSECKFFDNFAKDLSKEELVDITTRYDKYNELRTKRLILTKKED